MQSQNVYPQNDHSQPAPQSGYQSAPINRAHEACHQLYSHNAYQHPVSHLQNGPEQYDEQSSTPKPDRYSGNFDQYFSIKCHGTKAAMEMKPTLTRGHWHSVTFEAALSCGGRKFDWARKTTLQLTKSELLPVIAVLLGIRKTFAGKSHGEAKNKGFELQWQNSEMKLSLFCSFFEGGSLAKGVPISPYDALMLGHLAMSQYILNFPQMTAEAVILSLQQVHKRHPT